MMSGLLNKQLNTKAIEGFILNTFGINNTLSFYRRNSLEAKEREVLLGLHRPSSLSESVYLNLRNVKHSF